MAQLAADHEMPTENLISPEIVRRVSWAPPADLTELAPELARLGARSWQIELVTPLLAAAMLETEPLIVEVPDEAEAGAEANESE
jgi:ribonuclease D